MVVMRLIVPVSRTTNDDTFNGTQLDLSFYSERVKWQYFVY